MSGGDVAVVESLAFCIGSPDQQIILWTPKASEVLGYKAADVLKKVWHEFLVPPEARWEVANRVSQLCEDLEQHPESNDEVVFHLLAAQGGISCMKFRVLPFNDPSVVPVKRKAFKLLCVGHTPLGPEVQLFPFRHAAVPGAGIATFATRDFEAGEMILEEEPFFTRLQPAAMRDRKEWDDAWAADFNRIQAPLTFPEGVEAAGARPTKSQALLASAALVRDALGFALAHRSIRDAIMNLSSPPLDLNHALIEVSKQVAGLCKRRLKECRPFSEEQLLTAILVTEMNTFPGGRMFWTISRLNHSCSPNCVFLSVPGRWGIRALRPVASGEELTLSYLGEELLWPTPERRRILWRSKAFLCGCPRCADPVDRLLDRPCLQCASLQCAKGWKVVHRPGIYCRGTPSTSGKALGFIVHGTPLSTTSRVEWTEEGVWVEIDKEHHAQGGWALISGERLGKNLRELLSPSAAEVPDFADDLAPPEGHWLWGGCARGQVPRRQGLLESRFRHGYGRDGFACKELDEVVRLDGADLAKFELPDFLDGLEAAGREVVYAHFEGTGWRCPRCDHVEDSPALLALERDLGEKARKFFGMQGMSRFEKVDSGVRKLPMPPDLHVCALMRLADDARAVFGRRHYAWQLGALLAADLDNTLPRYVNIRREGVFYLQAACTLLELWDWLSSCGVSQDPAVWLHHRASELLTLLNSMHGYNGFKGSGPEAATVERLRQRVGEWACDVAPVDILGPREFIPEGLFPAS